MILNYICFQFFLRKVISFVKKESVLTVSFILASISTLVVHPSKEYVDYFDYKVLACLFSLMLVISGLSRTGIFQVLASALIRKVGTLKKTAFVLISITFFLSMWITNDVALLTFIPFALIILKDVQNSKSRITILVLMTIAANIGSALTPFGNPQNLFLFTFYHLSFDDFISTIGIIVLFGGFLVFIPLVFLADEKIQTVQLNSNYKQQYVKICIYIFLFIVSILVVFDILPYFFTSIFIALLILFFDKTILLKIDYSLLLTFIFFFIFIGNFQQFEMVIKTLSILVNQDTLLISVTASQIISNVPAAILLSGFTNNSSDLIRGVSIGGLGTLISSLASVITFKLFCKVKPNETGIFISIFSLYNFGFLILLYIFSLILKTN